jgi:hypothetical protein
MTPVYTPAFVGHAIRYAVDGEYRATHPRAANDLLKRFSEQVVAAILTYGVARLLDPDEEGLPGITGTQAVTARSPNLRGLQQRAIPPMHIRIPGTKQYVRYARLDPLATTLAVTVDLTDAVRTAVRQGDWPAAADAYEAIKRHIVAQIQEKTFLRTANSLYEAFQGDRPVYPLITDFISAFVPNMFRGAVRAEDKFIRETRMPPGLWRHDKAEFARRVWRDLLQDIGGYRASGFQPRVGLWGQEVTKEGGLAENYFSPFSRRNADRIVRWDRMLVRWNAEHPQEAYAPAEFPVFFTYTDQSGKEQRVYLDDEEVYAYRKLAGAVLLELMDRTTLDPENPTKEGIDVLKSARERAYEYAKGIYLTQAIGKGGLPKPKCRIPTPRRPQRVP